ncbi:MAG: amino acid ABC transporter permease [Synergistaceae bacterium]|nr:amino acid ABC transporter permease [Synergistaceae bacterium]
MQSTSILIESLPNIAGGLFTTLGLVIIALAVGFVVGLPLGVIQVYGGSSILTRALSRGAVLYVWFLRGLPNLVLLFLFYYGIFPFLGIDLPPFFVGATVLGLRSSAYQSQIFRGALLSIDQGQMHAARSLGMSRALALRSVILPQALRISLPAWSNEYPILLTDSSVCYAIGVMEMLTRASLQVSRTRAPVPLYLATAAIFIIMNYLGMSILRISERRWRIPGFGGS